MGEFFMLAGNKISKEKFDALCPAEKEAIVAVKGGKIKFLKDEVFDSYKNLKLKK